MSDIPLPKDREAVTEEPDLPGSRWDPSFQDNDWLGFRHQGGGRVPDDYEWTTNPRHDRLPVHKGN